MSLHPAGSSASRSQARSFLALAARGRWRRRSDSALPSTTDGSESDPSCTTSGGSPVETYGFGDIVVNFKRREVTKAGAPVDLSPREFRLLQYFIEHRGEVVERDHLLHAVWDYQGTPLTRTVDMHVAKLRGKLEEHAAEPHWIVTVHRVGYRFTG